MKTTPLILVFLLVNLFSYSQHKLTHDSLQVIGLNKLAYEMRFTSPEQSIAEGKRALKIAQKIRFKNGIAEANRIIGIGNSYLERTDTAIARYLIALKYFQSEKNFIGEAKVLNNIGNLYRTVDFHLSLTYYTRAFKLAQKLKIHDLEAGCYLNIGLIHVQNSHYTKAKAFLDKSLHLFRKINDPIGITQALQNLGVVYHELHQLEKAKLYLVEANKRAKENDLNKLVGKINLALADLYVDQSNFKQAEVAIEEGLTYAELVKNEQLKLHFLKELYYLENKRKNYSKAIVHLRELYQKDSSNNVKLEAEKINLLQVQQRQVQKQKEQELQLERQEKRQLLYWYSLAVLALSVVIIILLMINVKKKAKTNQQLKRLNEEISLQKESLNKVNQNLESIIEERTQDLQLKNIKLSEYSSHLSHEIRSPVATMKGLMLLEQENLIDDKELIRELNRCIENIDYKIMNLNHMLHNPQYKGAYYEPQKKLED
ncbi:tetratricopeptide repeat protein [Pedobacter sp. SYSU D00535]|uniref:tetratricopeptide repeat protein n=1 Tax=Pedobacter sp. SYSU D00535 TaxID=2810308 RepID=UPI001A97C05F|nr:tetratricopeptide repeat protein [Pedobacter sp. SYSU D00535]